MTEEGKECLNWNSYFIFSQGSDPYSQYSDFDGLEENFCRYGRAFPRTVV